MAFVAGDIVAIQVQSGTLTRPVNPQPPIFGVVETVSDPDTDVDVVWNDGRLQTNINGQVALDVIGTPAANEVTRLVGQVVRVQAAGADDSETASYDALVVDLYTRAPGGVSASDTRALVKTLTGGVYREVDAADLQLPAGR